MHFFTDIAEIEWPSSVSCGLEFGLNGEAIVCSVDGNASLLLSPSKEEFSVEFLCRASQTEVRGAVHQDPEIEPVSKHVKSQDSSTAGDLCSQNTAGTVRLSGVKENGPDTSKAQARQGHLYSRVVQHHSCACPPPVWTYPLSLALSLCDSQQRKPSEHTAEEGLEAAAGAPGSSPGQSVSRGERCRLPEALPLTCPTPHQHRWNLRDSAQRKEQEFDQGLRTELVKVLWLQGVVYRLISGAIAIIEICPGDGSVIRSNGAVANYFTHHAARLSFGQNEERTYCMNRLPPDVPGLAYSISCVVTRANRILKCYNQARLSLKLPSSHCCWSQESRSSDRAALIREAHVAGSGHFMAFSDGRVHVIFLDGVTLQMMWSTSTPAQGADGTLQFARGAQQLGGWCQLVLPNGQRPLVQLQAPGSYSRYVSPALQWSRRVLEAVPNGREASCGVQSSVPGQSWSVVAELEKIKRFNFLLEHSGLLKAAGGSAGSSCGFREVVSHGNSGTDSVVVNESSITEALQKTSKAIQDIEMLLSVRKSTNHSTT
ncbi:uncharacterized protein C5orf34 homolog [Conger conger]|uniref:uncharacterized protein C5orf34 homolog n=1 Tax=Conger conger TaxID=82655 RepID=UPI002A5AFDFE|nr:uncharacterized protein C5orf34 homolog [Conger conger]XP_061116880.1 uncharacterized protein C5orf34 homolog [Conger conger]XP_061116881.1 uncharacterized protein C5orf34 homolog [Conger conger]